MKAKRVCQMTFFIIVFLTSVYYFYIGQWKAYVAWYGVFEFAILLFVLALFVFVDIKSLYVNNNESLDFGSSKKPELPKPALFGFYG